MSARVKSALLDRLDCVLSNFYHNATPNCFGLVDDELADEFWEYVQFRGECEFDYISEGLGYSPKEWLKQKRIGFYNATERKCWLVWCASNELGGLYQYGRGGRTVAPAHIINTRGAGRFIVKTSEEFSDLSNAALCDLVEMLEALNEYIENWNGRENMTFLRDQFLEDRAEAA